MLILLVVLAILANDSGIRCVFLDGESCNEHCSWMSHFGHHIDKLVILIIFPPRVELLSAVERPLELEMGKLQIIFNLLD